MHKPPMADPPPEGSRARELWLNHAAGYVLFRDVRDYARDKIPPELTELEKAIAYKAIDDAVYGVMMHLDGVPERLENDDYCFDIKSYLTLAKRENGELVEVEREDFFEGFCMGYFYWLDGDFGEHPITSNGEK